jgi:hypothetical protein
VSLDTGGLELTCRDVVYSIDGKRDQVDKIVTAKPLTGQKLGIYLLAPLALKMWGTTIYDMSMARQAMETRMKQQKMILVTLSVSQVDPTRENVSNHTYDLVMADRGRLFCRDDQSGASCRVS